MKNKMIVDIIKDKNIVIPLYLYRLREKLNLTLEEFLVLMYLDNQGELILFDVNKVGSELGLKNGDVLGIISNLNTKGLIDFKVIPNDRNIKEEYISLDNFYNKTSLLLMDEKEEEKDDTNIFAMIEREFGRTLSPIECEIVKAWLDNNMSVEIIQCALKETVMNGVNNLRYMDKILYEWGKKGIKTKEDVAKNNANFKKKEASKKIDVFDYDWLDDENGS